MERRLTVALLAMLLSPVALSKPPRPGWHLLVFDSRRDSTALSFGLRAEGELADRYSLACRCRSGVLEIVLANDLASSDARKVEMRFDSDASLQDVWTASPEGASLMAPDARVFGAHVADSETLRIHPENGPTAEFAVRGFAGPWRSLIAACPEPPPIPPEPKWLPKIPESVYVTDLPERTAWSRT